MSRYQMTEKIVRRYLSQRCIGYARDARGVITDSIMESVVEYTDGSREVVREYYPALTRLDLEAFTTAQAAS